MRLMFILQFILDLQIQSIDFTDAFAQADIPCGETIVIDSPSELQEFWRKTSCCSHRRLFSGRYSNWRDNFN